MLQDDLVFMLGVSSQRENRQFKIWEDQGGCGWITAASGCWTARNCSAK